MYSHDGLTLRAIERRDLETLRLAHNHPSTLFMLTDTTPVTPAMQEQWFAGLGSGSNRGYVIEDDAGLVAFVRMSHVDLVNRNACIGLDVMPERRRQGFGARCYRLLLDYLFRELGLNMVWMLVADFNAPAIGLYRKMGFTLSGVIPQMLWREGRFRNCLVFTMTKDAKEKEYV